MLKPKHDMISTDWKFSELKTIIDKIVSERAIANTNQLKAPRPVFTFTPQIKNIKFLPANRKSKIVVETEIPLKIAAHTYLK